MNIKIYKDTNGNCVFDDGTVVLTPSQGTVSREIYADGKIKFKESSGSYLFDGHGFLISEIHDSLGVVYADLDTFKVATKDFFKKAGGVSTGVEVANALGYTPAPLPDISTPDLIQNLTCWIDATDAMYDAAGNKCIVDGTSIATVLNKAITGNNPVVNGTPKYYSTGLGGKKSIKFDGASDIRLTNFFGSSGAYNTAVTIAIVAKALDGAGNQVLLGCTGSKFWLEQNDSAKTSGIVLSGVSKNPTFSQYDNGTSIHLFRFNGTSYSHMYDRCFDGNNNSTLASANISVTGASDFNGDLSIASLMGGFKFSGHISEVIIFNRYLTDSEFVSLNTYLSTKWGIEKPNLVVCAGNSLTSGTASSGGATQKIQSSGTNYPSRLLYRLGNNYSVRADAYPGRDLVQMNAESPAFSNLYYTKNTNNICVVWELTNFIATYKSGNSAIQQLVKFCRNKKLAGFKVVVCTGLYRQDGVSAIHAKETDEANSYIRLHYSEFADKLCDLAADSRLQNPLNTTYFNSDKVHLNDAGYDVVSSIIYDVVKSI